MPPVDSPSLSVFRRIYGLVSAGNDSAAAALVHSGECDINELRSHSIFTIVDQAVRRNCLELITAVNSTSPELFVKAASNICRHMNTDDTVFSAIKHDCDPSITRQLAIARPEALCRKDSGGNTPLELALSLEIGQHGLPLSFLSPEKRANRKSNISLLENLTASYEGHQMRLAIAACVNRHASLSRSTSYRLPSVAMATTSSAALRILSRVRDREMGIVRLILSFAGGPDSSLPYDPNWMADPAEASVLFWGSADVLAGLMAESAALRIQNESIRKTHDADTEALRFENSHLRGENSHLRAGAAAPRLFSFFSSSPPPPPLPPLPPPLPPPPPSAPGPGAARSYVPTIEKLYSLESENRELKVKLQAAAENAARPPSPKKKRKITR